MALDSAQVEALQNIVPTDWSKFDQQLSERSNYDANRYADDARLHVRFFNRATLDPEASAAQNRPVYKDEPFVECMIPGDKQNIVHEPVWAGPWRERFPKQWEQFQAGIADQLVGTPLKRAPFVTDAQIAELAFFNIRTIEQLAGMPESNLSFMGARMLRDAAKRFLDESQSNSALLSRIAALEAQLAMSTQEAKAPPSARK